MIGHDLAVHLAELFSPYPTDRLIADIEASDELMALAATDIGAALERLIASMHLTLDAFLHEARTTPRKVA